MEGYRWGYGGHEKLDEVHGVTGSTVDMGDRWLDTRLGRTPKPDAKANKYPNISPYAYALNNPIKLIDPDGRDVKVTGEAASGFVNMTSGFLTNVSITRNEETGLLSYSLVEGVKKEDLSEFEQTLIQAIDDDKVIEVVAINSSDKVFFDADVRDGGGNEVDMGDFSLLDGKLSKFQEALVGHFIQERLSDENFSKAHSEGLEKETAILNEKYPDITSRSHTLERSEIEAIKTTNSDGTYSDYFKLLDYGSSSGEKSNALWIRYDYKSGETPNINSPSGVNTTNDVVKKSYGSGASVPSDID